MMLKSAASILLMCAGALPALAQWDPTTGLWGKEEPTDIRVMTWNIQDGIVSTSTTKTPGFNDWNALVHIVAALRPDVLILQEAGDNSGNGTGTGVDSVGALTTTIELFMHGGNDPFRGNVPVTAFVQLHAPDYDLPYIFVSNISDGFNRNVILSRFPIADVNGDGLATFSNFVLLPDAYQGGGNGGIRDFMHAEIDLPDETFMGDLVIGNCHLKSGGDSSDYADRLAAAKNIAYFIDYFFNGAGTGMSDPNAKIVLPSTSPVVLDQYTPVIWGGDLNENEATNGRKGPAEWFARAALTGGADGTDRDRSDSLWDTATQPITGETGTFGSSTNKLDYLVFQDSVAPVRRQFIFRSSGSGMTAANLPLPVRNFPTQPLSCSGLASDHRPVIIDFMLALVPDECTADWNSDGVLDFFDVAGFLGDFTDQDPRADLTGEGAYDFFDVATFLALFDDGCP